MRCQVGAITSTVRNSEIPVSTMFGGVCCRPSAWRKSDSTITIRVNEVSITSSAGASVTNANSAASSSGSAARLLWMLRSNAQAQAGAAAINAAGTPAKHMACRGFIRPGSP